MKSLVTIMAHGDYGAQRCFDRHLNYWRAHGLPIQVMCPIDSQIRTGLGMVLIGRRGHHGEQANARFRKLIEILVSLDYDRHIIYEYDSLCLVPELPVGNNRDGVYGITFSDERLIRSFPGSKDTFEGKLYLHPPIIMNKWTMTEVLHSMSDISDKTCHGMWDRFLGLACERSHIPVHCFRSKGLGYSQNTITVRDEREACEAAAHGAVVFHGVKSKETLDAIVLARQCGLRRLNGHSEVVIAT